MKLHAARGQDLADAARLAREAGVSDPDEMLELVADAYGADAATATPSASLLAGAARVRNNLADSLAATDTICIYGGDTPQQRRDGQLIPWHRLHHPDTVQRLLAAT